MAEPGYLKKLGRLPAGQPLDELHTSLLRGPEPATWRVLVSKVSGWSDGPAHREAVAALAAFLDDTFPAELRQAPHSWWNEAQRGQPPVGWPLVRFLRTHAQRPGERFEPCSNPASLAPLVAIDSDDVVISPEALAAGASALRTLRYTFERAPSDRPEPLERLADLAGVEDLTLILLRREVDLAPLAQMKALRQLGLELADAATLGPAGLAPLASSGLELLRVTGGPALGPNLAPLARLAGLRVLRLDPSPRDLAPLVYFTALKQLALYRVGPWQPGARLPGSLRDLTLAQASGLLDLADLAHLARLESLTLQGCDDLRVADVATLGALQTLRIVACPALEAVRPGKRGVGQLTIEVSA